MKLGEMLVRAGKLTAAQVDETLKGQAIFGGRFGTNLVEMGYLSELELAQFLSQKTGIPHASPEDLMDIPPQVTKLIPEETVRKHKVMPVAVNNRKLTLAMLDPNDFAVIDQLSFATGYIIVPVIAPELRILTAMEKHYSIKREVRYIRVQGGTRGRSAMGQDQPIVAQVTIAVPPSPQPPSQNYWSALPDNRFEEEEAEILELPTLDELDSLSELDEQILLAPMIASAVKPPQPAPAKDYSLEAVTRGFAEAENRDEVADLIIGHLAQQFGRVALFLHKGGVATGWLAQADKKVVPDFQTVEIPLAQPSVLKLVDDSRNYYLGPLPITPGNRRLADALGGGSPANNLLMPLLVAGRVVAVLYLDGGTAQLEAKLPELQKVAAKASMAFEILVLKSKILMT